MDEGAFLFPRDLRIIDWLRRLLHTRRALVLKMNAYRRRGPRFLLQGDLGIIDSQKIVLQQQDMAESTMSSAMAAAVKVYAIVLPSIRASRPLVPLDR